MNGLCELARKLRDYEQIFESTDDATSHPL